MMLKFTEKLIRSLNARVKNRYPNAAAWLRGNRIFRAAYWRLIGLIPFDPLSDMACLLRIPAHACGDRLARLRFRLVASDIENLKDLEAMLNAAAGKWRLGERIHE